ASAGELKGDTELGAVCVKTLMDAIELEQMPKALRMMLLQLEASAGELKGDTELGAVCVKTLMDAIELEQMPKA
ncbi:hypothetical protein VS883_28525, partial [Escherichia coli]